MLAPSLPPTAQKLECEQGTVIAAKYVLERPAGFGGMSQLWVATNKATGAEVCVKLLLPTSDVESQEEAVQRFRREAHAAARLNHRAIVRVFDLLELDDKGDAIEASSKTQPYAYAIVMELLKGETLGDLLAKRGKLPLEEAIDVFLPVISAMGHAHRASVIHRDIKPDNIFLAKDPDDHIIPKVLDFGVSKLPFTDAITIDGVLVGTPSFMSPEQAKGARLVDARSDVFSSGILFYMMLSGVNPFEHGSFASAVEAILRCEVNPLEDIPKEIWAVLKQSLEKDPAARFGDCTEMSIALRKACGRKSTTESNPLIMSVEPVSQRTLARALDRPSWNDPNPNSSSSPSSSPSSDKAPSVGAGAGAPKSKRNDSNVSVPPVGPDSSPVLSGAGNDGNKQRRNRMFVFSIIGFAAVLLIVSFVVKAVRAPTSTPPPPAVAAAMVAPEPAPSSATPITSTAPPAVVDDPPPEEKPKPAPSSKPVVKRLPRKAGDPHIARDPGF